MNSRLSNEDAQVGSKHLRRRTAWGKCQPKPQVTRHFTSTTRPHSERRWQVLANMWRSRDPHPPQVGTWGAVWKSLAAPQKHFSVRSAFDLAIPLVGIYAQETKASGARSQWHDSQEPQSGNNPNVPHWTTDKQKRSTHTEEYYSVTKRIKFWCLLGREWTWKALFTGMESDRSTWWGSFLAAENILN